MSSKDDLWKEALRRHMPYNGPWPRADAPPHSADAYFTNPDARLRPYSLLVPSTMPGAHFVENDKIEVTRFNFPQLHAKFMQMQQRAGLMDQPYRLFIGLDVPSKASVLKHGNRREIKVDLSILNRTDWDSFQFWVGHELGHAWQYANPEPRVPIRDTRVQPQQRYEVSADIFAVCLAQDRAGILRGMNGLAIGNSSLHPGREIRQSAAAQATNQDCATFDLWPGIPAYLQRRASSPRK